MKPNRRPPPEIQEASRERFACPICSGRNIEIDTVLLGGCTDYECSDCGWWERHDPRQRRSA